MKRTAGIVGAIALTVGLITVTPTLAQAETRADGPTVAQSSADPSVTPRNIKRNKKRCQTLGVINGSRCQPRSGDWCVPRGQFGYDAGGVYVCREWNNNPNLGIWYRY